MQNLAEVSKIRQTKKQIEAKPMKKRIIKLTHLQILQNQILKIHQTWKVVFIQKVKETSIL